MNINFVLITIDKALQGLNYVIHFVRESFDPAYSGSPYEKGRFYPRTEFNLKFLSIKKRVAFR